MTLPYATGNLRTRWYGAAFFLARERVALWTAILPPREVIWLGRVQCHKH
jgi:hypothetical protein